MIKHYEIDNISFDWDEDVIPIRPLTNVKIEDEPLNVKISNILTATQWNILDVFQPGKTNVRIPNDALAICDEVFSVIKKLKEDGGNVPAAYLASRMYEGFSGYWMNSILNSGKNILGISLWNSILEYTKNWESNNEPITVHKGTPYYFLGVNYFLLGHIDNAFVFFYNAIEDDKKLPELDYPKKAPIYQTVTLTDNTFNQMYPYVVKPLRNILERYVNRFQTDFDSNFTVQDIDKKFLQNEAFEDLTYFFVYNFMNLHDLNYEIKEDVRINEFSKLKALDQFFNLVLVIDQILKHASQNTVDGRNMYHLIQWWAEKTLNFTQSDLDDLIGRNNLNLNASTPQDVVQDLLDFIQHPAANIPKEVYVMLLAYHLRNYAGHNVDRHDVLISKYDEILEKLFMAIFLAVKCVNI